MDAERGQFSTLIDIGEIYSNEAPKDNTKFLQDVPSRVHSAGVDIEIRWDFFLEKPFISTYEISINNEYLAKIASSYEESKKISLNEVRMANNVFRDEGENKVLKEFWESWIKTGGREDEIPEVLQGGFGTLLRFERLLQAGNPFFYEFEGGGTSELEPWPLKCSSALPDLDKPLPVEDQYPRESEADLWEWGFFVKMLSALIVGPGKLVRKGLRELCYLGPLREIPKRNHTPGRSPEESRWSDGSAAYDYLFKADESFIWEVNDWLTEPDRLNSSYSVEVKKYWELEKDHPLIFALSRATAPDEEYDWNRIFEELPFKQRLLIKDQYRNIELAPQDIGVGLSQILPVIVAALHWKRGMVAIEQPELHIHPAFQVALGDLFIEQVNRSHVDRSCLNFIIETHSEHLLLRLLRRIRETSEGQVPESHALKPDDLSICFFEPGREGVVCHQIRVNEDGDFIDRWPRGFFDERAEELF